MKVRSSAKLNAGDVEHVGAMAIGAALVGFGLARRSTGGWAVALLGGAFILRGAQGYSRLYRLVGMELPDKPTHLSRRALRIDSEIIIDKSPGDLYEFWRRVENLPVVMKHIDSVITLDNKRSHWVAKAPAGMVVEWEAEIINDVPGELIAWRSLEGGDVDHAGSVHFEDLGEGRTRLWLTIRYTPPGDILGAGLAKILGADPKQQVEDDLREFKRLMEGRPKEAVIK